MMKLELKQTDNVLLTINKIKAISDESVEIVIPRESVLFENILNLKLIQQQAEKFGKNIDLITDDELGNTLLESLSNKDLGYRPEEFVEKLEELEEIEYEEEKPSLKIKAPKISAPSFSFPKFKKNLIFLVLIPLVLIGSFIYYGLTAPKAKASITVGSQPFTRSITVKVLSDSSTDTEGLVLRGNTISVTVEESLEKDTTGIKIVGEKAKGEVTIYNRTTSEIELEKGDKLTYKGKSTDLNYFLRSDVEVPPSTPEDPLVPESKMVPGEAKVKIEAEDIGDVYNLDDGRSFEFSNYEKEELIAKNEEKVTGGKSEEIKIVTEEDKIDLLNNLTLVSKQKAETAIRERVGANQKLIEGSTEIKISSEVFSAEVDEEKDKISLKQTVIGEALVYTEGDLNKFIDDYFKNVIPENHYMPDRDKEIKVEVLGSSTNSVLTSKEADIQVTLRSIVIPDIKEEEIKESLKGKTNEEAKEIIESLKNVEYYEFSISPAIPFFSKVPNNNDRIEVILVKENTGESL
ncbi:hypothetical protein K0B04_02320 [Patescibacteria group bacterium]|nr:hypothetical protein [Patescibacteria group bacterium]